MRILLVGEYSRLHNSLKEGLQQLGHEVIIVGNGDEFKKFPVDFDIEAKWSKSFFPNLFRQAIFRIFKYDFAKLEEGLRFKKLLPQLVDFDVVQLISETPLQTNLSLELSLMKKLKAQNGKLFILSSGADVPFVNALFEKKFRYSMLDPYVKDNSLLYEYRHLLQYRKPELIAHHEKMYALADGIIATDIDYKIPLQNHPKFLGMIANPVNLSKVEMEMPKPDFPIVVFLGINRANYHKKGIAFFEKALDIAKQEFGSKIEVKIVENVPYSEYRKMYSGAHILLDQVYAYDQGYNALEAMAAGKVVFTGAESEFVSHYGLSEKVAVNALPDVDYLVSELSRLIQNPEEIAHVGERAKSFVAKNHDHVEIAKRYVSVWKSHGLGAKNSFLK